MGTQRIWKGTWETHSKQPKAKSLQIDNFKQATARFQRPNVHKEDLLLWRFCFFLFFWWWLHRHQKWLSKISFFVISKQINFGIWKGAWEAHSKQPKAKSLQIGKFKQATARFQRPNVHKDFHWRFCVFSFFLVVVTPWSKMVVKDGFVISQQINFGIFWR